MSSTGTRRDNGLGTVRKRKGGGWEGRYTVGIDPRTGKKILKSVYAKTQAEVKRKLITALTSAKQEPVAAVKTKGLTFGSWLDTWFMTYCIGIKPNTVEQYRYQIKHNIRPSLGNINLISLTADRIQKLYSALMLPHTITLKSGKRKTKPGLSPKSIKNGHGVIHEALDKAVQLHYLTANPADCCELPKVQKTPINPIPDEYIQTFLEAVQKDPFSDLFLVDLFTGMRQGEILGLTWECVNFTKQILTVRYQLQKERKEHGKYRLVSLKNNKERTIRPAPFVMDVLRTVRVKQADCRRKCQGPWHNEMDLVFTDEKGNHCRKSTVYNHLKRICKSIGIPKTRFHDLRHTFATISLQNGDNIKLVSDNLGHATVAFTLDVYGHVSDKMREESAARMQEYYDRLLQEESSAGVPE